MGDRIVLMGYDPAQHRDYAGVVIVEVVPWRNPQTGQYPKDNFDYHFAQLNVRWLDRWRGFDYEEQVPKLLALVDEYNVNMLVIDNTGVGSAPGDMLAHRGLGRNSDRLMRIVFTGGDTTPNGEPTPVKHTHHVAKQRIIAALVALFASGRIKGSKSLPLLSVLKSELKGYRVKVTESANQIYINQDSEHDDLLCATSMCAVVVQRLWGLRYLPDLSEFVGWDDPPLTIAQQLSSLPNHPRMLAENARKQIQAGEKKVADLSVAELAAYRSIDWDADDAEEDEDAERQKAVRIKREARDRACWPDSDDFGVEWDDDFDEED